jgi:hypothetical protein
VTATTEQRLAAELNRRGLAAPARLLVAAHLPLAPLFADAAAVVGPLLGALSIGAARDLRSVVEDAEGMGRLVAALDDIEEPDAGSR